MWCPTFTPKLPLPLDDHYPDLIHPSLDRPHLLPQTASGSNQPFCHSTLSGQTDTWDWQKVVFLCRLPLYYTDRERRDNDIGKLVSTAIEAWTYRLVICNVRMSYTYEYVRTLLGVRSRVKPLRYSHATDALRRHTDVTIHTCSSSSSST